MWKLKSGKFVEEQMAKLVTKAEFEHGGKASKATSKAQNQEHLIGSVEATSRKKVGTKVDLLYKAPLMELGAIEVGAFNDRSSTKSIMELGMKCLENIEGYTGRS
ncbi:hypothetical protein BDB00DRAFT_784433 [Zychaea mexicana]|uniref:uncharacterized protein n=1 Tax=Zychaea mexicana TaxID=64656 RepID=UPI0022FDBBB1|nr:uncharacterized protein BDB00DRAFT_784433 [Zychaea mexicana]KAI9497934.1 hypothetical protein BDB00DRAFT_784433 [Zychaea mexicana]